MVSALVSGSSGPGSSTFSTCTWGFHSKFFSSVIIVALVFQPVFGGVRAAGTLCCVLGQDTLLSQCPSPPRCINGYRRI